VAQDREKAIAEIAAKARADRPKSSRAMWIAAAIAIVIGAIALVVVLFSDAEPTRPLTNLRPTTLHDSRAGLATGIAIGLCAGIAIGFAIGRRRRSLAEVDAES
jgi:hypothetical protein